MKYKIFIIIISKTHLTMSNFAELQCFNKLILQKMQRMQKKIEKLETENLILSNQEKEYRSLLNCVDLDDVNKCWECELWHERCYMFPIGDTDVCEECFKKENYFECDNCGEAYCEDEMKKMKMGLGEDCCNRCYKGFLLLDIIIENGGFISIAHDAINVIVFNRDKVMEELLKKVKTN